LPIWAVVAGGGGVVALLVAVGVLAGALAMVAGSGPKEAVAGAPASSDQVPAPTSEPSGRDATGISGSITDPAQVGELLTGASFSFQFGESDPNGWQTLDSEGSAFLGDPLRDDITWVIAPVQVQILETASDEQAESPQYAMDVTYVTASGTEARPCDINGWWGEGVRPLYMKDGFYPGDSFQFLACAEVRLSDVGGGAWKIVSDPDTFHFAGPPAS
jgi:hypothetical protein